MRIDVHAHYYPDKYIGQASRLRGEANFRVRAAGAAVTLEQRVDLLDQSGIRVQNPIRRSPTALRHRRQCSDQRSQAGQ